MRIVHIVPGAGGGFYCQNCVRDVGLVRALHATGMDVLFMPMYLPFAEMADGSVPQTPVFYGAVNVYLEQNLPLYRRLPARWRQCLDSPRILRWAASKAGTTQAAGLGNLTLSVLEGRDGRQRAELDQMLAWLKRQPRTDIMHLSNALLLGLAPDLRAQLDARIVCTLQDEDTWLDALPSPWRERCWEQIRILAGSVDRFIPVSQTYAAIMQARLAMTDAQRRVIAPGVDTEVFYPASSPPPVPTLGFLSELTADYGLDLLVDAFLILRRRPGLEQLRLRMTGSRLDMKNPFRARLAQRLSAAGLDDAVNFTEDFRDGLQRCRFLQSLNVLSVPARRPESFGLFLIEAMACGVPVVQPRLGGYPEVVRATGGGVIYDDASPQGLANALYPLLTDPGQAARYGQSGRDAVVAGYSLTRAAATIAALYRELVEDDQTGDS